MPLGQREPNRGERWYPLANGSRSPSKVVLFPRTAKYPARTAHTTATHFTSHFSHGSGNAESPSAARIPWKCMTCSPPFDHLPIRPAAETMNLEEAEGAGRFDSSRGASADGAKDSGGETLSAAARRGRRYPPGGLPVPADSWCACRDGRAACRRLAVARMGA